MTADPGGADDTAVASRLDALDDLATGEHLAVYTAIADELAGRLDGRDDQPEPQPHPTPLANLHRGTGDDGRERG